MTTDTRVALIEDHQLLAESLRVALTAQNFDVRTVPVLTQTRDASSLLTAVLAHQPHVVLLDLDLGNAGDGTSLIEPLDRAGSRTIVVTADVDPARWGRCLAHGASAVLPKSTCLKDIVDAIGRARSGRAVVPLHRRQELVGFWQRSESANRAAHARLAKLTRRESEVLAAIVSGCRVGDIARQSHVSQATVRTQVKSILFKLGVSSQIAAVAVAREAGWDRDSHRPGSRAR